MKYLFFKILPIFSFLVINQSIAQDATNVDQEDRENFVESEEIEVDTLGYSLSEYSEEEIMIIKRLNKVQKTIPLTYNDQVKSFLDKYISRNYKPYMEKLLSLSRFYFPIYETIFAETGIPDEVKYLSVVESSLNPQTVSRSGAVGPWQFMYATAKFYDLSMNSYVDERKDVFATSYAMSKYILEAQEEFNDWLLALASYNCGRGCVRRAIIKSGLQNPSFWELSPFLPQETRNYVPKYIAMTYALKHADRHNIEEIETDMNMDYKVLMVDKHIHLGQVAQAIDQPLNLLKQFNPVYKTNIVNGTVESPKRLLLPYTNVINDSLLYVALNNAVGAPDHRTNSSSSQRKDRNGNSIHLVKKGESLTTIADRYATSVQQLRLWNSLSAKSSIQGRNLIVEKVQNTRTANNNTKSSSTRISYVVKKGDTLSTIAEKHKGATVDKIKKDNKLPNSKLQIGQKLIILSK